MTIEQISRAMAMRRERCIWKLCRRYLAALCPNDPYDLVSFLFTMGLELKGVVSNYEPFRVRIMRGDEIMDEESI